MTTNEKEYIKLLEKYIQEWCDDEELVKLEVLRSWIENEPSLESKIDTLQRYDHTWDNPWGIWLDPYEMWEYVRYDDLVKLLK